MHYRFSMMLQFRNLVVLAALGTQPAGTLWAQKVEDRWARSFEEARALSEADGEPILLYFPSTGKLGPSELELVRDLRGDRGIRDTLLLCHLARARAAEVGPLLTRFGITAVPSLVLVGPGDEVIGRWHGKIPQDVWQLVERSIRTSPPAGRTIAAAFEAARVAIAAGNTRKACLVLRDLEPRLREGSAASQVLQDLKREILARFDRELRETLAIEGIRADSVVLKALESLQQRYPTPSTVSLLARETARVRGRSLRVSIPEEGRKSS